MRNVLVSCLCPTYGRAPERLHLLNECVYWYLHQDGCIAGQDTELVILNDAVGQTLVCDAPGVRVVNVQKRYPTLGDKYNALVSLARGDIILPWEDDDVSLPNRVAQSLTALGSDYDYWNPQKTWFEQSGQDPVLDLHGVNHNTSAYRRGTFAYRTGNDQDLWADLDAKQVCRVAPPGEVRVYVYRFGNSDHHCSGMGGTLATKTPKAGKYHIIPRMYRDYRPYVSNIV